MLVIINLYINYKITAQFGFAVAQFVVFQSLCYYLYPILGELIILLLSLYAKYE